jgi:transglutaminase-like putative cysteine protease
MTTYRVRHRTTYRYDAPVASGQTICHLFPRADAPGQQLLSSDLRVDPEADELSEHLDSFGNRVSIVWIHQPHRELTVVAESAVRVAVAPAGLPPSPPWEEAVAARAADRSPAGLHAREMALGSPYASYSESVRAFAEPSFWPGRPAAECLADLCRRIYGEFAFDPVATDVATPLDDVLVARRGVCQDYAHLAVAACRCFGLAARYVSGYLETEPPPGMPRLQGADASHAWLSVWVPGWGWLDADPTNDQVPVQRHVTVAWGRDYSDVAPVRGLVFGPLAGQHLDVAVDVVPVDPDVL